ncbi:acyl-CoA dehydrogenase NM domain-like protein [Annulohypoxylon truncatum]|uniref:acyl-CoA dehydrogenase NM domain-like protein n=1 Tax=Annulohypoxylon truncatum TaxID=327061 RepID=UPI002008C606|nr:acyl-CoA dehydrogenase NM domain-like protein [Annulohypoxylon truncatum]KAI1211662.1 acyl-CoA dehydrogenase NM domain-like protein [Annulohypoxylon truncatum]
MSQTYTRAEVGKHNTEDSLWFIIDSKVYDVTDFVDAHPGGESVLRQVGGQDATVAFYNLHRHEVLSKYEDLCVGTLEGEAPQVVTPKPGDLSLVPYAEPLWLTPAYKSPYYNDSHRRLQKAMRVFTDTYITPEAQQRELDGKKISQELVDRMSAVGMLHMRLGPGKHLHGVELLGGAVRGDEFDYFHDLIMAQEGVRANARGFQDGQLAGMVIGLPCVMNYMKDQKRKKAIMDEVFSGKKYMCLAITEAFAGSDVAGLRTTATKTPDGKHYIVNGTKKWITNGVFCDYFITGVKTDKGLSVLIIERGEGVETKPIKTSYSPAAGTAYITFDNVKVPVENLLGEENKGIYVILSNFNHERWTMACATIRQCRTIVEECLKWSHQRLVFGKRLIEQPVIRQKLAKMIALVEANQSWLETITYQMCNMPYKQQAQHLGGPIGLLKMSITRAAHEIADEAVQIFGGRGLTQSGMGRVVEMFHRTYKFDAILGGSEEVLADLGVRQAMRQMPNAKL